jgi:hypothetical protein
MVSMSAAPSNDAAVQNRPEQSRAYSDQDCRGSHDHERAIAGSHRIDDLRKQQKDEPDDEEAAAPQPVREPTRQRTSHGVRGQTKCGYNAVAGGAYSQGGSKQDKNRIRDAG